MERIDTDRAKVPPYNASDPTAPESAVFCYRRIYSLSVPFPTFFDMKNRAFLSRLHRVLLPPYRNYSPKFTSLSVVFLVREGPSGLEASAHLWQSLHTAVA